jgi:hypothetical protein
MGLYVNIFLVYMFTYQNIGIHEQSNIIDEKQKHGFQKLGVSKRATSSPDCKAVLGSCLTTLTTVARKNNFIILHIP